MTDQASISTLGTLFTNAESVETDNTKLQRHKSKRQSMQEFLSTLAGNDSKFTKYIKHQSVTDNIVTANDTHTNSRLLALPWVTVAARDETTKAELRPATLKDDRGLEKFEEFRSTYQPHVVIAIDPPSNDIVQNVENSQDEVVIAESMSTRQRIRLGAWSKKKSQLEQSLASMGCLIKRQSLVEIQNSTQAKSLHQPDDVMALCLKIPKNCTSLISVKNNKLQVKGAYVLVDVAVRPGVTKVFDVLSQLVDRDIVPSGGFIGLWQYTIHIRSYQVQTGLSVYTKALQAENIILQEFYGLTFDLKLSVA